MRTIIFFLTAVLFVFSCGEIDSNSDSPRNQLDLVQTVNEIPDIHKGHHGFKILSPEETGVYFQNQITEDYNYNILEYEYLYNGGGVAVGDLNNNGLPDLYFVSTFGVNKLYLNKGNYQFEDITEKAGVSALGGFKTGVTLVDINGNGFLDIYVCRTGKGEGHIKRNLLYINNGDMTFTESAAEYGLDIQSNSNQANFFDLDGDGNLGMYLMNHPLTFSESATMRLQEKEDGSLVRLTHPRTAYDSDKLFKNVNGQFKDISKEAGISNSAFGLSVIISDINLNGLPDIFVGNDFIEPDHLFINNGDGTFTDRAREYLRAMSENSMGADIADYNNDGLPDIMVLDMLAEDHVRYKELSNIMMVSRRNLLIEHGYGFQYLRNVLHLNRGKNSEGNLEFSEISRLAGVSSTDWSWGALFADLTNDGWKDLFIVNGYLRDVTNLDYTTYVRDSIERTGGLTPSRYPNINEYLDMIPSTPLPNYIYLNNRDLTFFDVTSQWNVDAPSYSSGSAYADLNGDGNLDLIVSNINQPAFIKRNLGSDNNYLQVTLKGPGNNTRGIGAKAWLTTGELTQYLELNGNRGFLSTSEHMFHFGLGKNDSVDELLIVWPDQTYQILRNVPVNQRLHIEYAPEGVHQYPKLETAENLFADQTAQSGIKFTHVENLFEDFHRERLLPHRLSNLGPALAVGDATGNGLDDVFIGGAEGQSGKLFIQQNNGEFIESPQVAFTEDIQKEDVDAVFFDANGNGAMDLLVLSGGYAHPVNNPLYNDRLYLNDGSGSYTLDENFPKIPTNSGPLLIHDFEGEGNPLIFVGGRALPLNYPMAPVSYILKRENDRFVNVTRQILPDFERLGMITAIKAADLNGNGVQELIVTGEWMPIKVFSYREGNFVDKTVEFGLDNSNGWWNTLHIADLNGDGKKEIIGGNLGLNARYSASIEEPTIVFADDFDNNGMIDPIICYYKNGQIYPYAGRDLFLAQLPNWRKKFPRYKLYADATITDIFSQKELDQALKLKVFNFESSVFKLKNGKYQSTPLPIEAQMSITFDIVHKDFNGDGIKDLLLVGNQLWTEAESAAYDASKGVILVGREDGTFEYIENSKHGLWASDQARKIREVKLADGRTQIIIANSNGSLQVFEKKLTATPEL